VDKIGVALYIATAYWVAVMIIGREDFSLDV
jgi:hypothetical protein